MQSDTIAVRSADRMPPLLQRLSERKPEQLDYLGVSFGLTKELLRFWKRSGFVPLYASQKENSLTGEYTFVMLRGLLSNVAQADGWLSAFAQGELTDLHRFQQLIPDFRQRFMSLLSYDQFKKFDSATALSVIDAASPKRATADSDGEPAPATRPLSAEELGALLTPFDMKRLQSYCENMVEHHVIIDLVPVLAVLFFSRKLGSECTLSAAQQAILLALGLQRKPVEALEGELGLTPSQVLALFAKIVRRIVKTLQDIQREGVGRDLPAEQSDVQRIGVQQSFRPVEQSVEEELRAEKRQEREETDEEMSEERAKQKELLDSVDLAQ